MLRPLVRDAAPREAEALAELQRRASNAWPEDAAWLAAHPEVITPPVDAVREGRTRVAVDPGGGLVGFASTFALPDRGWELDDLFVEPARMGEGVGRLLVEDLVARARAAGVERVEVTANDNALGFYERLGFSPTGELVATEFRPAPRMILRLS